MPVTIPFTAIREVGLVPPRHKVSTRWRRTATPLLYHIGWKTVPAFGECTPTLDREEKRTIIFQHPAETVYCRHKNIAQIQYIAILCNTTANPPGWDSWNGWLALLYWQQGLAAAARHCFVLLCVNSRNRQWVGRPGYPLLDSSSCRILCTYIIDPCLLWQCLRCLTALSRRLQK